MSRFVRHTLLANANDPLKACPQDLKTNIEKIIINTERLICSFGRYELERAAQKSTGSHAPQTPIDEVAEAARDLKELIARTDTYFGKHK